LAREDVDLFIGDLATQAGVQSVGLSTNGVRLAPMATRLARAGLRNVNISLDAIDAAVYERITGGQVDQVLRGIDAARAAGIDRIKLNAVLMRGVNDSQVWPLIEFASEYRLPLRFIELMPVSLPERVGGKNFLPIAEVQSAIRERTRLVPDPVRHGHGPAVYYRLPDYGILLGFIGAITDRHFCGACNKMRLTAEGRIRPCLGDHREIDLKPALRPQVDSEALRQGILDALQQKPWAHSFGNQYQPERIMTAIGG
jgi:cyclic pyranopterin phosphate synthase